MKVTFSWWESESEKHTSTWDVPWCNGPVIRACIDEHFELLRLRREIAETRKPSEFLKRAEYLAGEIEDNLNPNTDPHDEPAWVKALELRTLLSTRSNI